MNAEEYLERFQSETRVICLTVFRVFKRRALCLRVKVIRPLTGFAKTFIRHQCELTSSTTTDIVDLLVLAVRCSRRFFVVQQETVKKRKKKRRKTKKNKKRKKEEDSISLNCLAELRQSSLDAAAFWQPVVCESATLGLGCTLLTYILWFNTKQ